MRTILVDDDVVNRSIVRMVFEQDGRLEVVGEADDGMAGMKLALAENPDVVILDLEMPLVSGFEMIPELRDLLPDVKIVVFSSAPDSVRERALGLGAHDFVPKGIDLVELSDRIIDLRDD